MKLVNYPKLSGREGAKLKPLGRATEETKGYFGIRRENWAGGWLWGQEW